MATGNAAAIGKAAKEFESVFISQFLGSMFSGISTDGPTGGGQGEEMFRSLMIDQYGKQIEQRGGFGIASALQRQLLKHQEIPARGAMSHDWKMQDEPKIERLIAMAERLIVALESDIAALKKGTPSQMVSLDPEIQKLSVIYGREAQNFDMRIAKSAPAPLRNRFLAITAKFRDVLQLHARMLTRVKNASEGMIQAIAREVDRMNARPRAHMAARVRPARPAIAGRDGVQQSRLILPFAG